MDPQTTSSVLSDLIALLCGALAIYGGWRLWSEAVRSDDGDRLPGPLSSLPRRGAAPDAAAPTVAQRYTYDQTLRETALP